MPYTEEEIKKVQEMLSIDMTHRLVGKIREIRPGQWQYYFTHAGRRYFLSKDDGNKPLRSEHDALMVQCIISILIDGGCSSPNGG